MVINQSELHGYKLIIDRRESDTQSRRDNDVRASGDELGVKVTEVVFEACLHDCFEGLLCQNQRVFIITIHLQLVDLHYLVESLQLIGRMR